MVEGATEFRKNSFNDEDSANLAQVSAMFQNVADESLSAGDSASFIIAQMKAFGIEADNAIHIVDAVNAVSNNFAVSSGDLATNLGNMSAALAVGNNTFEQSLAMLTGITEVTRNASKGSRALVSVQSRLNQVVDDSSSTGQKLTNWYNEHNIAIYDQEGELRSLYEILGDVSKQWDGLSKNEQSYFLNIQAGANQSQNLASLLSNWDSVAKAQDVALNSAGSAAKENTAYMDSLESKVAALKSSFQELANAVITKEMVSEVLNLVNAFTKLADTGVGRAIIKFALFSATMNAASAIFGRTASVLLQMFTGMSTGERTLTTLMNAGGRIGSIFTNLMGIFNDVRMSASGMAGPMTASSSALSSMASSALSAITSLSPLAIGMGAVVAAGVGLAVAIKHYTNEEKNLQKSVDEHKNSVSDIQSQIDEYNSTLDSNKQRLEEINSLKGTSNWSSELENEASTLERQNALIERQITLQEQKLKAEQAALWQEQSKLFDKQYGDKMRYTTKQQNVRGEEVSVTLTGEKAYKQKLQDLQVTIHKFTQTQNLDYKEAASEAESSILSIISELEEYKEAAVSAGDTTKADYIQSLIDLAKAGDSISGGTIGEALDGDSKSMENAADKAEKLHDRIVNLAKDLGTTVAQLGIKAKDAFSTEEWLEKLDPSSLSNLEQILDMIGNRAGWLGSQLSEMSTGETVTYLSEVMRRFTGAVQDATGAYDEFDAALETDFAKPLQQMNEMADYIEQSDEHGVQNLQAYNKALEGVYGTTDKSIIALQDQKAAMSDFRTTTVETATALDNMKAYYDSAGNFLGDKLLKNIEQISKNKDKFGDLVNFEKFDDGTFKVAVKDFGDLADALGITQPMLSSFMEALGGSVDFQMGETLNAAQAAIQDIHDAVSDTDAGGISDLLNKLGSTDPTNIKNRVQDLQALNDKLNDLSTYTNVPFEFDFSKLKGQDFTDAAKQVEGYAKALQTFTTESGSWDLSGTIDKVNSALKDASKGTKIELDGSNIKFESEDAVNELKSQIEDAFGGMDFEDIVKTDAGKSVLANLFDGMEIDSEQAGEVGQEFADAVTEAIQDQLNTTQIALNGIGAEVKGELGYQVDEGMNAVQESGQRTADWFSNNFAPQVQQGVQSAMSGAEQTAQNSASVLQGIFSNMNIADPMQQVQQGIQNVNGEVNSFSTGNMTSQLGEAGTAAEQTGNKAEDAKTKAQQLGQVSFQNFISGMLTAGGSANYLQTQASSAYSEAQKLNTTVTTVFKSDTTNWHPPSLTGTGAPKAVGQIPAYANGKMDELSGTKPMRSQSSQIALVGEEGAEFRITADGRKELLGKNGAEFVRVNKGDTIIPANVTDMIRKGLLQGYEKGKLGGRTSVSGSGVSNGNHTIHVGKTESRYVGATSSSTKSTNANTKATNANTSAKSANASASSEAADATDKLTEAQKKQKEAFEEANDVTEHHIFLREKQGATYAELIKMSKAYQKQLNQQANWWRSQGFNDDSEEIRKIQKDWWGLQDDITSYQEKAFNERYQKSKDYIDDRNDLEDWGADSEIEAWHRVEKWMDEWYARGEISYKYYLEKRKEATKKAAEAEKKAWEKAKKAQIKELEDWQEVYEDLFDLVADKAQEEIDKLKEQRDTVEKYWDDKIDALEKANDELDDQIEKEKALDALARARSTKVMVYQNGRFQYINDMDEVSEAKTNLEKIEREQALKKEKENLEKQKEAALKAIDDQIEAWEKYKDEWDKVVSNYQKKQKELNVLQKLGIDLEAENWKERLGNLQDYVNKYNEIMGQLTKLKKEEELGKDLPSYDSNKGTIGAGAGAIIGTGAGIAAGGVVGGVIGGAVGSVVGTVTGGLGLNKGGSSSGGSSSSGGGIYQSVGGKAPSGLKAGDKVVTNGGTYTITGVNKDGSYTSQKTSNTTKSNYKGTYSKKASGTKYNAAGISLVGEEGAELRVLGQGEGIVPHDMTANLFEWGQTRPSDIVSAITSAQNENSGVMICIENFNPSLPNVVDGEGFANYLKNNFWRNVVQYKTTIGRA